MNLPETSRQKVLEAIRHARLRVQESPPSKQDIQPIDHPHPSNIESESCLQRFVEMLAKVGGEGHLLNGEEAALGMLRGLIGETHDQIVLVARDAELERLAVPRIVAEMGGKLVRPSQYTLDEAKDAALGITVAQAGIADTGTVVLWHDNGQGRLAALLPPTHAVLLKRADVFPDKITYLREMQRRGVDLGCTAMTWVTGPSLTADIEKVLVRGAHGPRRVIVLLY